MVRIGLSTLTDSNDVRGKKMEGIKTEPLQAEFPHTCSGFFLTLMPIPPYLIHHLTNHRRMSFNT